MRADIEQMLKQRPSWRLHNDKDYQDLLKAIEYARQNDNQQALEELEMWAEQRKITLLSRPYE